MWSRGGVRVPEAPVSALTRVVTRALVRLTEVPSRHAAVETVVYSDVQFWVALSWVCTRPPRAIGLRAAAASRRAVGRGAADEPSGAAGWRGRRRPQLGGFAHGVAQRAPQGGWLWGRGAWPARSACARGQAQRAGREVSGHAHVMVTGQQKGGPVTVRPT